MRRFLCLGFVFLLSVVATVGCAATTVRKNPGVHDRGVRFYRPKPYLRLEPAVVNKILQPNAVKISLDYLPDYGEEYSIHVRAGIGKNKTNIKLENGWNLTSVNTTVDSKTSENIGAFSSLAKALLPYVATGNKDEPETKVVAEADAPQVLAPAVPARNVPLGYYESVIATSPDGCKRLQGWRYIGFSPYNPCPTCPTGVQTSDCCDRQVYGLVAENGVMVFKLLDDIANNEVPTTPAPVVDASAKELREAMLATFPTPVTLFTTLLGTTPTGPDAPVVTYHAIDGNVTIVAQLKKVVSMEMKKFLEETIPTKVETTLKGQAGLRGKKFTVTVVVNQP